MKRRLSAIIAADVVGYSRLIRLDEEGTIETLRDLRATLVDPRVAAYDGRIVKLMGDGMLAEFASVVDAVRAVIEIQQAVAAHNAALPENKRIEFRVGVNLGDVVIDGDDIQGDGVNVAARMETLAAPGGVCISGSVYEQVRDRIDHTFHDMGEQQVKNIARPVQAYRWSCGAGSGAAQKDHAARTIEDRPAVAVLPFDNMSGDPDQEYFSDGLTEDIITALALWQSFPVIARNSTFTYKGRSVDVRTLAKELGARYILEGSVRKSGSRVRITAQLIDAKTGHHVWAERYDRELTDIFELQDEIVRRIAATVEPELARAEQKRTVVKMSQDLGAWDCYQRGMAYLYEYTREGNERARAMFEQALEFDPHYGKAFTGIAYSYHRDLAGELADDREAAMARCLEAAHRGVTLDPQRSDAHVVLAQAYVWPDEHDLAIAEAETALELNPNNVVALTVLGAMLDSVGDFEGGIAKIQEAVQLNPRDIRIHVAQTILARAYLNARDYDKAAESARKALHHHPGYANANYVLAASLGHLGRLPEARMALEECERAQPGFIERRRSWRPYRNPADNEHILEGIRKSAP